MPEQEKQEQVNKQIDVKVNQKSVWEKETNAIEIDPRVTTEEDKQKLLQMSEISIWLDTYDDIFSDFDPRPYSQRALSDDFLSEAKKVSREKTSGMIELKLLIPSNMRNINQENIIRKRLREHFKKHYGQLEKEVKKIKKQGFGIVASGMALMMIASYLATLGKSHFFIQLLIVVFEPSGWFMTWFGMEQIFYTAAQKKQDLDFYDKMSKCQITFSAIN